MSAPAPLTIDQIEAHGRDDFPGLDFDDLCLGVAALHPREYLGDLPVVEKLVEPGGCSGRHKDWFGDHYLATDGDGGLVEVVVVLDDVWRRAAENGMGC